MKSIKKICATAALLLPIAGCWHVPISALWRLRQLDTLTLDPAAIRLAALAPTWIEAPPGHVHLRLVSHAGEADERELKLNLVESRDPADLKATTTEPLRAFARPNAHFGVFSLAAADVAAVAALQQRARDEKARGGGAHAGKIELTAELCRRDAPPGPARVDLFLSTGPHEDYFQIYEDVDLRDPELWRGASFEAAVPPCAAPAPTASDQRGLG